jgi:hypothetical protein
MISPEGYIKAVSDALHDAGVPVQACDAGGTRVRGGSITILADPAAHPADPTALRVLGWDEESGWSTGQPYSTDLDELTAISYLPLREVAPAPADVVAVATKTVGGQIVGTLTVPSCWREAGADDGLDEMLAAYPSAEATRG